MINNNIRDGYWYKCLNKENKSIHLSDKQKKELIKDYNSGKSVKDLSIKYCKVEKYIRILINNNL